MQARLSVNATIAFQGADCQPIAPSFVFSRFLETKEDPYIRQYRIEENWARIDLGWIGDVQAISLLVIRNDDGRKLACQPAVGPLCKEARAICLRFEDAKPDSKPHALVYPQETTIVSPCVPVFVRSNSGGMMLSLYALPR